MHRAFQIQEIINNVLDELGTSSKAVLDTRKEFTTLARLAQVGRVFLEPSLDALWRYQRLILPPLKTLPADSWVEDPEFSFRRPLVTKDWSRYDYYSKRIKFLEVSTEDIALNAYAVLELCRHTRPLLKNLSHLQCNLFGREGNMLCTVVPFLGPSLSEMEIYIPNGEEPDMATFQLIASLPYLAPALVSLIIRCTPGISSAVCQVGSSLTQLRTLIVNDIPVTPRDIVALARVGTLRRLDIRLRMDTSHPDPGPSITHTAPFPSLETLNLFVDHISLATNFIDTFLHKSSLGVFEIRFFHDPNAGSIKLLILSICHHFSPSALRQISLSPWEDKSYSDSDPPQFNVGAQTLRPLFIFQHLEVLNIVIHAYYAQIDDNLVEDISSAWPRLKTLELVACDELDENPRLTIKGLLSFTRCCDLDDLHLRFDGTSIDAWLRPAGGLHHSNLRYFDVDGSKVRDAETVAAFFCDVFPNLEYLSCRWSTPPWADISDRYHALVKIKKTGAAIGNTA